MTDERMTDEDDDDIFVDILDEFVIETEDSSDFVRLLDAMFGLIGNVEEDYRLEWLNRPVRAFVYNIPSFLVDMMRRPGEHGIDGGLEETDWGWVGRWVVGSVVAEAQAETDTARDVLTERSRSAAAIRNVDDFVKALEEFPEKIRNEPDLERIKMPPVLRRMKDDLEAAISGKGREELLPLPAEMDWFWLAVLFRNAVLKN